MTKVLIEVPDNLHRLVKTVASAKGESMKNFVLRAMAYLIKQETTGEIKNSNLISEAEADKILKPYLLQMAADIKSGKEKTIDSKKFFNELSKK